uniref:Transmembrane protein n=1 Tax=Panagrolaimus sp. PS1159 TaxID=55785 RepID=A0AC35GS18_9BILA
MKFIFFLLISLLLLIICIQRISATNKDKIFVRQDAVDLEDYEPFKSFKEHIQAADERKLNELLLKGRRVIYIVFSSLLLTLLFGGFMLHENKLFKNAGHRHIKCNLTNFTVIDFYNLSSEARNVKMEMIHLNKLLAFNLSIKTELQTILENLTNQYNQMKLKIDDQINLQRECDKIIQQQRYQILSAQRDAYLQRFHVFQVIYVIYMGAF